MKLQYFAECRTLADVDDRRKELVQTLHPDKGGDPAAFQLMQDEWRFIHAMEEALPGCLQRQESVGAVITRTQPVKPRHVQIPALAQRILDGVAAEVETQLRKGLTKGVQKVLAWWDQDDEPNDEQAKI